MSICAAESGDDNFLFVSLAVAIRILHKQQIGRIRDPDTAMSDGDSAGDIQAVHELGELVALAVAVGVFEDFDDVFSRTGSASRIFEGLGNPEAAAFVDGHGDRVDDIGFRGDDFDGEPFGNRHHPGCRYWITWIVRRLVLSMRNGSLWLLSRRE